MKKRIYCITTALCLVLCIVLCIAFAAVCSKAENSKAVLPEVRNNGTAIQWRDTAEEEWHDLVALDTLRGAVGENGKDGKDGADGKNGTNGKNGLDGKNGLNGKDGTNGKNGLDGKNSTDGINGTDGKNGTDGRNGIDGKNGVDGKNGIDGKDGTNGKDGIDGKDGLNGKDGTDGKNGTDGKDGIDGKDGADGKDGTDGKNGTDGKDGLDGKNIDVQRTTEYIQWRYEGEDWQNLVAISDIKGPTGQNGKDGVNGKTPEFRVNENNLQWRYVSDEIWLNLYDLSNLKGLDGKDGIDGKNGVDGIDGKNGDTPFIGENGNWWLGVTDIGVKAAGVDGEKGDKGDKGDAGQNGKDGANGKTPEFRVNENNLQWRYVGDEIWLNLYDLSILKGLDGADGKDGINGKDGADGKDGNTPFIGENGNWWIGTTDTGVKATCVDGEKGEKGDKGDKGEKGDAGQNGSCSGYFYGEAASPSKVVLKNNSRANITVYQKINKGGLISSYWNNITLKKGHIYNVCLSGSLEVGSNEANKSGNYSIQMTDDYDDDLCRELTRIKRDGAKIPQTNDQHSFNFNRMYDASNKDITLQLWFENSAYNTYLGGFRGTITITALD